MMLFAMLTKPRKATKQIGPETYPVEPGREEEQGGDLVPVPPVVREEISQALPQLGAGRDRHSVVPRQSPNKTDQEQMEAHESCE